MSDSRFKETRYPASTGGKIQQIRSWLSKNYDIRVNIFDPSMSEIVCKTIDYTHSISIQDIYLHMIDEEQSCSLSLLKNILSSPNQITTYNPIEEYFDSVRGIYRGESHIDMYCDHIHATEFGDQPTGYYQARMKRIVRKWIVAVVACVMGYRHNDVALGFVCSVGGIGKTSLFTNIIPDCLQDYYITSDNDDRHFKMTESFANKLLINFDEFVGISNKNAEQFKKNMSARDLMLKMPGSQFVTKMQRIGSAAFTSNKTQEMGGFIQVADSGLMRRLGSIEIDSIGDYRDKLDIDQLWSEAVMLADHPATYEWNQDDFSDFQAYNARYIKETSALQVIKEWYRLPESHEEGVFMQPVDMIRELKAAHKIKASDNKITDVTVGQALKRLGYLRKPKKIPGVGARYGYYTVPLY